MKIIAKTSGGFLMEASGKEIVTLMGFSSTYDDGFPKEYRDLNFNIGLDIKIEKVAAAAKLVRELNPGTLKMIHQRLCDAQQELEMIQELANSLVLFDVLRGEVK